MTTADTQNIAPQNAPSTAKAAFFILTLLLVSQLFKYSMINLAAKSQPFLDTIIEYAIPVLLMSLSTALLFFAMLYYHLAKQKKTLSQTVTLITLLALIPFFLILPFIIDLLYNTIFKQLYILTGMANNQKPYFFAWDLTQKTFIKSLLLATISFYLYLMLMRKKFTQVTNSNLSVIKWSTTGFALLIVFTILVAQIYFQSEYAFYSSPANYGATFKTMIGEANLMAAAYAFIVAIFFAIPFYLLVSNNRTCIRPWRTLIIITLAYGTYLLLTNTIASINAETYLLLTRTHIIPIVVSVSAMIMGAASALVLNHTSKQ